MTLPSGYAGFGKPVQPVTQPVTSTHGKYVPKLLKSLYGLKQAPRQCFEKLSTALLQFGFLQSKADYTLFTKKTPQDFTAYSFMQMTWSSQGAMLQLFLT